MSTKKQRIQSIDALRGFDMLMIIVADRFFASLDKGMNNGFSKFMANQFDHPDWFGSTFYDIIMPLFLFIVGAVIPFSIGKRLQEGGAIKVYSKLIRRFIILFILGWIVQGNLLDFDIDNFKVFSNTLQAIAIGYVFSSIIYIHFAKKGLLISFLICLVVYAILITLIPVPGQGQSVLLPDQNIAIYFDHLIFGKFDDGTQYTWLLSGFGFTATTLSGVLAGELIKSNLKREKVALYLFIGGLISLVIGIIWGIWHPIIKKIWTSSFVLASSGVCAILLSGFYWLIDVKGYTRWAHPLKIIGMNAIFAYVISHVVNFTQVADFFVYGLEHLTGDYYGLIAVTMGFLILYSIMRYMYQNKTFIKV